MGKYYSTKTYEHSVGFSCCFRQWRANSHCAQLHGYPMKIEFVFSTNKLDDNNWCMDFGSLKPIKEWLGNLLDHKTLVAADDPEMDWFIGANERHIIDMVVVPSTGCEKLAEHIYEYVENWLRDMGHSPRVKLESVQVWEHEANSAIFKKNNVNV